jgi:hypothetical protein
VHIYDGAQDLIAMLVLNHGERLKPARKNSAEQKTRLNLPSHLETCTGRLENLENFLGSIK